MMLEESYILYSLVLPFYIVGLAMGAIFGVMYYELIVKSGEHP